MYQNKPQNIRIEGAQLIFKNFRGEGDQFNAPGNRNFGVLVTEEQAEVFSKDGWNVKHRKPDEDGYMQAWLSVKVKFGKIPPTAILVTSRGKIRLDETNIGQLDFLRLSNCDLVIRPYCYPATAGRPAGVSAYLKTIYATVEEDYLEEKYADLPYLDGES